MKKKMMNIIYRSPVGHYIPSAVISVAETRGWFQCVLSCHCTGGLKISKHVVWNIQINSARAEIFASLNFNNPTDNL